MQKSWQHSFLLLQEEESNRRLERTVLEEKYCHMGILYVLVSLTDFTGESQRMKNEAEKNPSWKRMKGKKEGRKESLWMSWQSCLQSVYIYCTLLSTHVFFMFPCFHWFQDTMKRHTTQERKETGRELKSSQLPVTKRASRDWWKVSTFHSVSPLLLLLLLLFWLPSVIVILSQSQDLLLSKVLSFFPLSFSLSHATRAKRKKTDKKKKYEKISMSALKSKGIKEEPGGAVALSKLPSLL